MKASEQCFPVALFIILSNVVLTFESVWVKGISKYIATAEQYFCSDSVYVVRDMQDGTITLKSTNMKPLSLITIWKKLIKQYFVVILFITLAVHHGGFN